MTLPIMKAGDRVRITVEGEVLSTPDHGLRINLDGADQMVTTFYTSELTAPTTRVEVLPPPVDPDLVLAREWYAQMSCDIPKLQRDIAAGVHDGDAQVEAFLAGLKAAKAGGRV